MSWRAFERITELNSDNTNGPAGRFFLLTSIFLFLLLLVAVILAKALRLKAEVQPNGFKVRGLCYSMRLQCTFCFYKAIGELLHANGTGTVAQKVHITTTLTRESTEVFTGILSLLPCICKLLLTIVFVVWRQKTIKTMPFFANKRITCSNYIIYFLFLGVLIFNLKPTYDQCVNIYIYSFFFNCCLLTNELQHHILNGKQWSSLPGSMLSL